MSLSLLYEPTFTASTRPRPAASTTAGGPSTSESESPHQVRYNPKEYGEAKLAALIFETEDFKTVWNFIGST